MFKLLQSSFDHLRLSFNVSNAVLVCSIGVKYQYTIRACAHVFFGNDRGVRLLEHVH